MLSSAMIDWARATGYERARLDGWPTRAEAIALYRTLGLREVAPFHTYPFPMVFMELDLGGRRFDGSHRHARGGRAGDEPPWSLSGAGALDHATDGPSQRGNGATLYPQRSALPGECRHLCRLVPE